VNTINIANLSESQTRVGEPCQNHASDAAPCDPTTARSVTTYQSTKAEARGQIHVKIPDWIQEEIDNPKEMGAGRNNQMIKIGPSLLRLGMAAAELDELFHAMFPDGPDDEIEALVRNSEKLAETEQKPNPRRADLTESTRRARAVLPKILRSYTWEEIDSETIDLPLQEQRRLFLRTMFGESDVVWIGEKFHSGPKHKHHFKTCAQWLAQKFIPGEFVAHATFKPGTVKRSNDNVAVRKYMVVESDALYPSELAAVCKYIRDYHGVPLRAIVTTGGKRHGDCPGLHFWFEPGVGAIEDWKAVLLGYKCDVSTLRGSQPVRLCGTTRQNTGRRQELLFLC
jgi:hypothetical protein